VPWTKACEPARGAWGPLYSTLLILFSSDTMSLNGCYMFVYLFSRGFFFYSFLRLCLFFLTWSFVRGGLDFLKGEKASRVSIARGRRSSQARRFSALKGLEVPSLLNHVRSPLGMKGLLDFFRYLGGSPPLLAPEGVLTMIGRSQYSLLSLRLVEK